MTNEEALKIMKNSREMLIKANEIYHNPNFEEAKQAYDMAIEALERDSRVDFITAHWNDEKNNFVAACNAFEDILKLYGRGVTEDE